MSEKRSWDIQPKRRVEPAPQAPAASPAPRQLRPQPAPQRPRSEPMVRRSALQQPKKQLGSNLGRPQPRPQRSQPEPVRVAPARRERVLQGKEREPLRQRRRRARRLALQLLSIAAVLAVVAAVGALWLPAVRIQTISTAGQQSSGMQSIAQEDLNGSYYYLFPKDSIFFFPSSQIRSDILARYPDVSAVSMSRTSFHSILLSSIGRETAFLWCGSTYGSASPIAPLTTATSSPNMASSSPKTATKSSTSVATDTPAIITTVSTTGVGELSPCYDADSQGYVFAQDTDAAPSAFRIYGPLSGTDGSMVGNHIANAGAIPDALSFVKAIRSLGVPIVALVIRGDEADLYAQSGTKITYVLGREQMAAQLAQAGFPDLNLNDGTVEYVDLRFDGKVYYKKNGQSAASINGQ